MCCIAKVAFSLFSICLMTNADARPTRIVSFGPYPATVNLSNYSYSAPNGADGIDGSLDGENGTAGKDGADGATLVIMGHDLTLVGGVSLTGGNGGRGGYGFFGGMVNGVPTVGGGNGAKGGQGGKGGSLIVDANILRIQASSSITADVSGGSGGEGGSGGGSYTDFLTYESAKPGDGARGGDGGPAGRVSIIGCFYEGSPESVQITSYGGNGGDGGWGGWPWYATIVCGTKTGSSADGGNSFLCPNQAPSSGHSIPGVGGWGGPIPVCQSDDDIYLTPGNDGIVIPGGCFGTEVVNSCFPPFNPYKYGGGYDTGWFDGSEPGGGDDPPPAPGPDDDPPSPGPGDPGPGPNPWPNPPGTPSNCGTCGSNLVSDEFLNPGTLSCAQTISDSFLTSDVESYCEPVALPGETTTETLWADRIWAITPTTSHTVTIRAYTYYGPYILAVGKAGNLSSEGFKRSYGGYTTDITFVADGSTYYVTLEALFCAEQFKLQALCFAPPSNDELVNATLVSCGYEVQGVPITTYATPSSLAIPPDCYTSKDVWFKINAGPRPSSGIDPAIGVIFNDDAGVNGDYSGYVALYKISPGTGTPTLIDWRYGRLNQEFLLYPVPVEPWKFYYIRLGSNSPSTNQRLQISCHPKL